MNEFIQIEISQKYYKTVMYFELLGKYKSFKISIFQPKFPVAHRIVWLPLDTRMYV